MRHRFKNMFEKMDDIVEIAKNGLTRIVKGLGLDILTAPVAEPQLETVAERPAPLGAKGGSHED